MTPVDGRLHRFRVAGVPFVLDVTTGTIALLDEVSWDVLPHVVAGTAIPEPVLQRHGAAESLAAAGEFERLEKEGHFLQADPMDDAMNRAAAGAVPAALPVKGMCLLVAEACNMSCAYCFASGNSMAGGGDEARTACGTGRRMLMPTEVAERAIEFLVEHSGNRRRLDVDFFGGEPMLNFDVVSSTSAYAVQRARLAGKTVGLTLTTNGSLLDQDACRFLNDSGVNMVISLDGRASVHDRVRRFASGRPSYEECLRGARLLTESRRSWRTSPASPYTYVRGTYTHYNLDFAEDVLHLVDEGFDYISMEPVVCESGHPLAITESDLPRLFDEYERLAREYVRRAREGRPFRFFHFELDLDGGPCIPRRMSGCGAGRDYIAVTPDGSIYPCHQFVGREGFVMGNVWDGITNNALQEVFANANVATRQRCRECWARYMCGGGCHANAHMENGVIDEPYSLGCELQRKRFECAIYAKAMLLNRDRRL